MRITQAHGTVCQDLLHRIGLGSIEVRGNVAEIDEDGVIFEDGNHVDLDTIVFCTGYHIRFPFLPKSLQPMDEGKNVRLYKVSLLQISNNLLASCYVMRKVLRCQLCLVAHVSCYAFGLLVSIAWVFY